MPLMPTSNWQYWPQSLFLGLAASAQPIDPMPAAGGSSKTSKCSPGASGQPNVQASVTISYWKYFVPSGGPRSLSVLHKSTVGVGVIEGVDVSVGSGVRVGRSVRVGVGVKGARVGVGV